MLSDKDLRDRINSYLQGRESIASLEDWLSVEVFASIKKDSNPELRSLVASVLHSLDLHADDLLDDVSFKNELRALIAVTRTTKKLDQALARAKTLRDFKSASPDRFERCPDYEDLVILADEVEKLRERVRIDEALNSCHAFLPK